MSSVHSLKSLAISKFYPEQMEQITVIMEDLGYDFKIIIDSDVHLFNTSIEKIKNFNIDYDGWWNTPYRIAAFTTNPELHDEN